MDACLSNSAPVVFLSFAILKLFSSIAKGTSVIWSELNLYG